MIPKITSNTVQSAIIRANYEPDINKISNGKLKHHLTKGFCMNEISQDLKKYPTNNS